MNKSGFSKEKYDRIMSFILLFIPIASVSFLSFLVLVLITITETDSQKSLCVALGFTAVVILVFCLFNALIVKIVGTKAYKEYAARVIKHNKNEVEKIELTFSDLVIHYKHGRYVENVTLNFADYGIMVRSREDVKIPHFYMRDDIIYKLEFPFVDDLNNKVWSEYDVIIVKP